MQLKYRFPFILFAALALVLCRAHAQEDDDDEEEFGTMGFYSRSPQTLSVALKLTQGPNVNFSNLGTVVIPVDNSKGDVTGRTYMDGRVYVDGLRPYNYTISDARELKENGDPKDPLYPNTDRYKVYVTGTSTQVGDYLSYRKDRTRSWEYVNASQASATKPGYIAFHNYRAETQGDSLIANRGYTGGVELAISRSLTNPGKRVSVSFTAGLSLAGINNSKSGDVTSTLHSSTDYYLFYPYAGTSAPVLTGDQKIDGLTYRGPTFDATSGINTETTTTVSANPDEHEDVPEGQGDVVVKGRWKVRGAYFTLKLGPQINAMITRSLGVTASVGVAGSYVGTTYSASESFTAPEITELVTYEDATSKDVLLAGYYASIDATWALNERAGFFAGASYDNLGDYTQSVGNRTAKIDLSATAGVRGGLNIKF